MARPDKVRGSIPIPELDSIYDYRTGSYNDAVTVSYTAEIKGANIGLDMEDEHAGIYFVNTATAEETKVAMINRQTATKLIFTVPQVAQDGEYTVVVRKSFGSTIREGRLAVSVRVNVNGSDN